MTSTETLRLREDGLTWQELDGQVVLLDLKSSHYVEINRSGATLFHRLLDGADRSELQRALQERYGLEREQAARDVDAFLGLMAKNGLLAC